MGPSAGAKDCSAAGMMKMEGDFQLRSQDG